ncbi:MAG: ABC transporter ATP-binding protein [Lachnospiraceae bacterium]|nr:ABC transporter ATP-binding protein [Lachnospiraceae bacterium]
METILSLHNISKSYGLKKVLDNINLNIKEGEYISITGESGAGKSTLLNIIGGLDYAYEGEYYFQECLLVEKKLSQFRNKHIGFIFQQYNLLSSLSSKENVLLPYVYCKKDIDGIEQRCEELFEKFSLKDQKEQIVSTLSGGEKQRVALLRSIIMDPDIILADEPTGNLDNKNAMLVREFLKEMNMYGKTIIVVTHDIEFANEAKRHMHISGGGLYEI